MTNQQKDDLNAWLSERFPILSKNDVYLIVTHIEHYFLPAVKETGYDDESGDYIKASQEEI